MQFSIICKRITSFILVIFISICFWEFMIADTSNIKTGWVVLITFLLFLSTAFSCILCMQYMASSDDILVRVMEELDDEEGETQNLIV